MKIVIMNQIIFVFIWISILSVFFTSPNKQLPSVKSVSKSFDNLSSVYKIYNLTTFYEQKTDFCVIVIFLTKLLVSVVLILLTLLTNSLYLV